MLFAYILILLILQTLGHQAFILHPTTELSARQSGIGLHKLLGMIGFSPVIPPSPRHQSEHAPAQVFTRVSGVALGLRG